jgi:hypothetical protein
LSCHSLVGSFKIEFFFFLLSCYGQPANINANGEFDAEELERLGIQPLPDNLGAGGFTTAVAYNANGGRSLRREKIVARFTADDIVRRPKL